MKVKYTVRVVTDEGIKNQQIISKVYGKTEQFFPSGKREVYKVWNTVRNSMEWVKADYCVAI